ncbi:MAG: hypothetical protein CMQ40_06330 [Gammaproteobacteria bacterium]|nr:hypothetical protein [Gammaproteobacteria bacterium]|tara:strand:- start:399 stop:827 length:429 start_codon:yes stop_codon:yes gene_type:complete
MNNLILQPALFMGVLSTIMMIWMYATRLPASKILQRQGANLQELSHPSALGGVFPSKVERVADNYNHLWEQPTLFYAVIFVIWAHQNTDTLYLYMAWSYCALRFLHSVVQSTINHVWIRFSLFMLSWIVLASMLFREILYLF